MDRTIAVAAFIAASLASGCYRFAPPVARVRETASADLSCEEIEVRAGSPSPYAEDASFLASGCGRERWYTCTNPDDARTCTERDGAVLATPHPNDPHAIVKLRAQYFTAMEGDVRARKQRLRVGDAVVHMADSTAPRAYPIAVGPTEWSFRSSDLGVVTEYRPYAVRVGTWVSAGVAAHTEVVERASCEAGFRLDAQPGHVYRVQYSYFGPSRCEMTCAEETPTVDGSIQLVPCTGFSS